VRRKKKERSVKRKRTSLDFLSLTEREKEIDEILKTREGNNTQRSTRSRGTVGRDLVALIREKRNRSSHPREEKKGRRRIMK